jgi:hypothetical protein
MPPVWMPGCKVVPSLDRQVTEAMIFAGFAFASASDRTASMAVDGFGINGAAGAGGSRYSVLAALSSQPLRAGFAWFALRTSRSRRTRIALIAFGTLEASAKRHRAVMRFDSTAVHSRASIYIKDFGAVIAGMTTGTARSVGSSGA